MGDFIKIDRKLMEWEWYKNINTCRLFVHMLLKANWKETKYQGNVIPRGSFVSSIGKLSVETALTSDEVRTALKHLISTKEITKQSFSKYTVFTVNNYSQYQSNPKQKTKQFPSNSQAIPKQFPTIEEKKEDNNIYNTRTRANRFMDFYNAYPKQKNMLSAEKEYVLALFNDQSLSEEDLIIAAENYAEAVCLLGTAERFIKNPDRFLSEGRFVDYLDKNYKKPKPEQKKTGTVAKQFNQFPQREYDFEALEKEILGG